MLTPDDLIKTTISISEQVTLEFEGFDLDALNYKPSPKNWSILECLEHLNCYSRYYLPALEKAMHKYTGNSEKITHSWLGKKSLAMVQPQNQKKYKTVKHMNPANSLLNQSTIAEFLHHQTTLLRLLKKVHQTDLNKKAIPVEFFKLLKHRIGETLEFVVTHQERHVDQAMRVKQLQLVALKGVDAFV